MSNLQALHELLKASQFEDAWSDDGICYADTLLSRLNPTEWQQLSDLIPQQSRIWKLSLASALGGQIQPPVLECVRQLMSDPDEEIFYEASVSLEQILLTGAEASAYIAEYQSLIVRMKCQTGKDLLGVYSLEKLLNTYHHEVTK